MLNLSQESTFLINYYDELLKNSNKNFQFISDNKKNSVYINFHKHLYDLLDNINDILNKDLEKIYNLRTIYNNNTREYKRLIEDIYKNHFTNNPYIDNKIKKYIKNIPGSLIIYELPFKDKTILINIITYSKISPKLLANYDKLVKNMITQIYLITNLIKNNNCSKNSLNIYLFLTPFKRELEKKQENILGSNNVNGGFCYGCVLNGNIIVYRQEEVFKVFTHELIHNYGLDEYIFKFMTKTRIKNTKEYFIYKKFLKNFNLSRENNLGIQESIVEFWGEFFNNVIYSFNYSKSCNLSTYKQEFKFYKQVFETIMKFETMHSFLQSTKILSHNRLNYIDILSTNNKSVYREKTHIFSYFILKLYILFGYKEFINSQISVQQENTLFFNNSLQNMEKFLNYMILLSNNPYLIQNMKYMREIYISIKVLKIKNLNFLLNNLRMSVLEYD